VFPHKYHINLDLAKVLIKELTTILTLIESIRATTPSPAPESLFAVAGEMQTPTPPGNFKSSGTTQLEDEVAAFLARDIGEDGDEEMHALIKQFTLPMSDWTDPVPSETPPSIDYAAARGTFYVLTGSCGCTAGTRQRQLPRRLPLHTR
jgi:hypothetical protein